jgi:hypothetical protein
MNGKKKFRVFVDLQIFQHLNRIKKQVSIDRIIRSIFSVRAVEKLRAVKLSTVREYRKLTGKTDITMPTTGGDVTNWSVLDDKKLYTDGRYAINYLKNNYIEKEYLNNDDEKIIFHAYWYGKIGRKQIFSIKSFLCTQDLSKCELCLWIDEDYEDEILQNPLLMPLRSLIIVKVYRPVEEAAGTVFHDMKKVMLQKKYLPARADAFRYLVLFKYGGVYFDLDVLFLRNMLPLLNREFCYAWENQPFANNAILCLKRQSALAQHIMEKCRQKKVALSWIIFDYADLNMKDMLVYPCAFFDLLWQKQVKEDDRLPFRSFDCFFRPFDSDFKKSDEINSYKDFLTGCYAYHWHNLWSAEEVKNSYFGLFDNEFSAMLSSSIAANEAKNQSTKTKA